MSYKDIEKRRSATKERVRKCRENKKVLQGVTVPVCPECNGREYIELNHGLIMQACKCKNLTI
jgi:hypothetical protein